MKIIENFDETYDGGTGNLLSRKRNDSLQESFGYDNLERLLSVVDENGTKVFDASYDAWGKQVVTLNTIGLHRGYTGHEMLSEFDIINMNQRSLSRYDSVLGRFFSPDNYVQMPDNSQSFNRYSYCLNNPLKYMDPSGNLFGIDDAIIAFAAFNMASSMMQAAFEGKSVWKAGALSLLSSGASYGIGELFKGTAATFGNELLRAGAHGLASGVISALDGDNFASAFVSGAAASGMGSYAQSVDMINIGLLNDAAHDGNNDNLMGGVAICEVLPDGTYVAPEDIPCVIVRMVGNIQFSTPAPPIEKPLESVHPEFDILFGIRGVLNLLTGISTNTLQKSFSTYREFKKVYGSAGEGFEWHHNIVEQRSVNVERFGAERIHNIDNMVALPNSLHRKVSGFYSSKQWWTKGVRVRDWLTNQTFEEQYNFGIKTIKDFDGKAYLK